MEENTQPYTGRYARTFFNGLVGRDRYTVRSFSLDKLATREGFTAAMAAIDDDKLSLAYVSDTKLTCVWLHDYPGWLAFCAPLGLRIRPSSKIAKRLTTMTRTAYLSIFAQDLKMCAVKPDAFSAYEVDEDTAVKFLDGANVISRELVEEMMTNGTAEMEYNFMTHGRGNPYDRARINRAIDEVGSVSLRVLYEGGQIKGDALVVPREQMPEGADVVFCTENVKTEVTSSEFIFVLAEPQPHPRIDHETGQLRSSPVWTDDQTMSWLGDWLYPFDQLYRCLQDFAEIAYRDIEEGRLPRFFTDTDRRDDLSTITQFQDQALRWEEEGLGIEQSIFLHERVGQGAINQLSKKRRWPIPCAMYVHVATDSWLHMAGFFREDGTHPWPFEEPLTPRGSAWYHEESGRLIYNDLDFAELYPRHGGWDLDDSIKVHFRTMGGRKKLINVRSPNSMGEYDIKDYVEGTFAPTWTHADGTVLSFPEVSEDRPPFIEELDITYQYTSLVPPSQGNPPKAYTKDQVRDAIVMARAFKGKFGQRANADMAYFGTMRNYRRKQLAPIEAIVDASTQEQSEWALDLIEQDTSNVIQEIREAGVVADATLWNQRVQTFFPDMEYAYLDWSKMAVTHDTLCELYKKRYFELAQRAVENIDPDVLDLGRVCEHIGGKLVEWYYKLVRGGLRRLEEETDTEFYRRVNATMCQRLAGRPEHEIANIVLGMARYVYSNLHGNEYKDTPLFQSGKPGEPSMFTHYLAAIRLYGINQLDWFATAECSSCERTLVYEEDRVAYQTHLLRGRCATC